MVTLLRINSWKGRMAAGVGGATIYKYIEPNPMVSFRSFPSGSVGLLLGVTTPAGQHGRSLEHKLAKFSYAPYSRVRHLQSLSDLWLLVLITHSGKTKTKKHQEGYCTLRGWPQSLLPGQEGAGRKGIFLLHCHILLSEG